MTSKKPPPRKAAEYTVGYRKPPVETRFKPGRSGNPAGRTRGARNKASALDEGRLKAIILEEAYRGIKINEGDRSLTIPIARAVVRSLAINAAKGQLRSQQVFAKLLGEIERDNALADENQETVTKLTISWEEPGDRKGAEPVAIATTSSSK
jgi:hypothetical protein